MTQQEYEAPTVVGLGSPVFCRSGRSEEAYRLLCEADDWGYHLVELLRSHPDHVILANLRRLRWHAADLFDRSKLPDRSPERIMYTNVDIPLKYSHAAKVENTTMSLRDAVLISSMREDGSHSPALDLDYEAELWRDSSGSLWLRMLPQSPAIEYHGRDIVYEADRAMGAMGLTRCSPPAGLLRPCAPEGHASFMLGPAWEGSFEALVASSRIITPRVMPQPAPLQGVWYEVEGDAHLIPSTSWHHLYIEKRMTEARYWSAVQVAAACGILNPGFANGMGERGFTSLRSPGLVKAPLMPVDDIPF